MVRINSIIFLLLFGDCAAQFCASTVNSKEDKAETVDCKVAKKSHLLPFKTDITQYTENKCNVVFIMDIGSEFVSQLDYQVVMMFMDKVATNCMKKGIGFQVSAYPMFNKGAAMTCCSIRMCEQSIGFMNYDVFVPPYGDTSPIVDEDANQNWSFTLVDELKTVNNVPCAYNSAILLSNRLFRPYDLEALNNEIDVITGLECLTFSQVIFGRGDDITMAQVQELYGNFSDYQYLVPNVNCLDKIPDCIAPCGTMTPEECQSLDLTTCAYPTLPTTTPSTTTTTPSIEFADYWHIIYVFAISNRTTTEQFNNMVQYIGQPIMECKDLLVRFLAPRGEDSQWISDLSTVDKYLNDIRFDEIVVPGGPEAYDSETTELMWKALGITVYFDSGPRTPRITLVSDFASQTFIDQYQTNNNGLLLKLGKYDFQIITFSEEVAEIYRNHSFKASDIHVDDDFDDTNPPPLCSKPPVADPGPGTTTILFIIIGSCLGLMLLLVVATIVFRQKYIWMERLHAMKREGHHSSHSHHDDDIIDYWEMSWDDLIVKNDRLGHGAHGQVFRGKLRGASPGVEHFFRPEDRMNYVNCDVAIKMLPSATGDRARDEFLREIDMMKSMGYNEHIVNMLGCVTTHKRLGLVLEYCAQGDLSRILKVKKADLEVSRSIDNQLDCTKQFLQYAWQVAHGMEFLQKQGIIHRDLAARNVLVDMWGNAKVGDFGLCIRSDEHLSPPTTPTTPTIEKDRSFSVVAGEGRLPIKWLAIECLQYHKFTHKSDVWSYGIVLFEMYSLGELPFVDIDPSELLDYLRGGGRPPRPLISCDKIFEVMTRCWSENPDDRPTFQELLTILAILIEQSTEGYGYLQLIKASEYKTLTVPESVEKKRSGTGASNRSGAEKEKEKFIHPWKKLAATLKARSVFSPSSSATTNPSPATNQNIPTITIQEPSTSAATDGISNKISPDIISRLRSKVSFRQTNEVSASNHDLPSSSTAPPSENARERSPAITRSTPKLNLFVNSRILGKNLSSVPQLTIDQQELNRVKFMPNGYDRTPSPPPVSICIDGHPSPIPISFPRSRGPTIKSVQIDVPDLQSESSESESEDGIGHLGRWSFHRRSALTRRQSMPNRPSMERERSHSLETTRSHESGSNSRKISRISMKNSH